jgi:predicted nucleic acid-binding protein
MLKSCRRFCHRFAAIGRRDMIQWGFDALLGLVDEVFAVERRDVETAKDILLRYRSLSSRGAIHVAVMARHGIERIMSFDRGFDQHPDVVRLA